MALSSSSPRRTAKPFDRVGARDFSRKINRQLLARNFQIVGAVAVPAFEGDQYCSGTAYKLVDVAADGAFIRSFADVQKLAATGEGAPTWAN